MYLSVNKEIIENPVSYSLTSISLKMEKLNFKKHVYLKRLCFTNRPFAAGMLQASLQGSIYGVSVNGWGL
ncbi:hypothetical protein MAH4_13830 [Sessilibacter sp. MAH4]